VTYAFSGGHDKDMHASDLAGIHGFLRLC